MESYRYSDFNPANIIITRTMTYRTPHGSSKIFTTKKALSQCWLNVGPASQTLAQHSTNIDPICLSTRFLLYIWLILGNRLPHKSNINQPWSTFCRNVKVKSALSGYRHRRSPGVDPALCVRTRSRGDVSPVRGHAMAWYFIAIHDLVDSQQHILPVTDIVTLNYFKVTFSHLF